MRKKIIASVLMACLMLSLCACGQKELTPSEARDAFKESMGEITLSQALSDGRTLWYYTEPDDVAKDKTFELFIFENGKVTYYDETDVTFGDLDGLSDDDIIKLVDESAGKDNPTLEVIEKEIKRLEYEIEDIGNILESVGEDERDPQIIEMREAVEGMNGAIATLTSLKKDAQSQSPQPMDYQLKINTDGSGNNTQEQVITYTTTSVQITYSGGVPSLSEETASEEITLIGGGDTYPIYEMFFGGFITGGAKNVLLTQVDDYTMFALDAPNTEGIETK